MKKALLLVSILAISVVTTACINRFAVQELNSKAMEYMEQGKYSEAIERLVSSIDLDESVFESHYNLAVAYTKSEDYGNAINSYKRAISLKPDFADAYYSLAVAEENTATDLSAKLLTLDDNGNLIQAGEDAQAADKLPENVQAYADDLLKDAIKNYNEYLAKNQSAQDSEDVQNHIRDLENKLNMNAEE